MTFKWVRPQQAPDDEVEVFSLGSMRSSGETPDAEDDSGEVLGGRYELLEVLACGGTAAVYRTRDHHTGALVATKVLYKGARAKVGLYFGQEGRLAARIRGPHLVHASDFGEDDGRLYIVFDLVPGQALSEMYLEPMPWRELLAVVLQVLKALAALHGRGVVHRDVKPDNVIVSRSLGELHVTLLDLGFAALAPEKRITAAPEPCRRVFGTYGFIAPELFAGRVPEPRCDLYSVGALMYTMLTTLPVPDLQAAPDVLMIPPPSVFLPALPEAVDDIVVRALSDVEARFQSVQQMADAVRAALAIADAPVAAATATASLVVPPALPAPEQLRPFRESTTELPASPSMPGLSEPAITSKASASTHRAPAVAPHRRRSLTMAMTGVVVGAGLMLLGSRVLSTPLEPTVSTLSTITEPPSSECPAAPPSPSTSTMDATPPPQQSSPENHYSAPSSSAPTPTPAPSTASPPSPASTRTPDGATLAAGVPSKSPRVNRSGRTPPSPRKHATFAEAMKALEPTVHACAVEHGVPVVSRTVQVRRDEPLFVRVWGVPATQPFAKCVTTAVRDRPPPLDAEVPVQSFIFFNDR